jgi:hypothetical protein
MMRLTLPKTASMSQNNSISQPVYIVTSTLFLSLII